MKVLWYREDGLGFGPPVLLAAANSAEPAPRVRYALICGTRFLLALALASLFGLGCVSWRTKLDASTTRPTVDAMPDSGSPMPVQSRRERVGSIVEWKRHLDLVFVQLDVNAVSEGVDLAIPYPVGSKELLWVFRVARIHSVKGQEIAACRFAGPGIWGRAKLPRSALAPGTEVYRVFTQESWGIPGLSPRRTPSGRAGCPEGMTEGRNVGLSVP
jgi:hypothetical protein